MSDHISICICTYKRPSLVSHLIHSLNGQRTDGLFSFSAVVVDNDALESGREAVDAARRAAQLDVDYYVEPERNISLARNRSVENARGNMIAFIDDDEFPETDWLFNHFRVLKESKASGVLGPVRPHFDGQAPAWLIKSGLVERREFATGQRLTNERFTRTGNVLLWRSLFAGRKDWFDPSFGKTGGGDAIFFKRMMEKGHVFIWCNEAVVYRDRPARTAG